MKPFLASMLLLFAGSSAWAAVDINTASVAELDAVKGITPKQAEAIVEYRDKNGPFKSLDDLKKVKGFGEKSVAKVRSGLSVSETAPVAKATAKK